jgi:hypothetical protein
VVVELAERAALRGDAAAVGKQVTFVVERDDAVAEQAPALLRMTRDNPGCVAVNSLC